jgi:hypothetical protein
MVPCGSLCRTPGMTVLVPYGDTSRVRLTDIDGGNSDTQSNSLCTAPLQERSGKPRGLCGPLPKWRNHKHHQQEQQ